MEVGVSQVNTVYWSLVHCRVGTHAHTHIPIYMDLDERIKLLVVNQPQGIKSPGKQ